MSRDVTEAFETLEYMLAQVAAESYLDGIDISNQQSEKNRFVLGANNYGFLTNHQLKGSEPFSN